MAISIEDARPADLDAVVGLLDAHRLPTDGLRDHFDTAVVARQDEGAVVGSAAVEIYGDAGLLRSVAVAPAVQGRGIGARLVTAAIDRARSRGVQSIYLLTTTADRYFPAFGFERTTRDEVPASVRSSVEFSSACPASATVMRARVRPRRARSETGAAPDSS